MTRNEKNISELTKEYIIKKFTSKTGNTFGVKINYYERSSGFGRDSKKIGYVVEIDDDEFLDEKALTAYALVDKVNRIFRTCEQELVKKNILFKYEKGYFENGIDYCWHSTRHSELEYISSIIKITPCKEFAKLQKWLKDKANFDLTPFDLFRCNVCKKRSSSHRSGMVYYCVYSEKINKYLEDIKREYKQGNRVEVKKIEEESFDGGYDNHRYEYEQYGVCYGGLEMIFSTPTGRDIRSTRIMCW